MGRSGPLRDNPDFRFYWLGQVASDLGSQMSYVAYPLLVLALGGTAAEAGGITSAAVLTSLVCRLPAGAFVDTFDRRTVMVWCDIIRSATVGSIPLAMVIGAATYPQLVAVAVVEGAVTSVFRPAAAVSVRALVPPGQLTAALARSQSRAAAASMVGPALSGWLFGFGRLIPFVVDAVSYLVSAVMIGRITAPLPGTRSAAPGVPGLAAGLRWIAGHRLLRTVLGWAGVVNMIATCVVLVVVVTVRGRGGSPTTVGLILAGVGVGAVLGAALAPAILHRLGPGWVFVGIGAGWVAVPTTLTVTAAPWIVGPLLAAVFVLSPASGIVISTNMLRGAPTELQGRVAAAADLLMSGVVGVGPVLTGVLLDRAGLATTAIVLASVAAVITLACLPTFRTPGLFADATTAAHTRPDVPSGGPR